MTLVQIHILAQSEDAFARRPWDEDRDAEEALHQAMHEYAGKPLPISASVTEAELYRQEMARRRLHFTGSEEV